MPPLLTPAARSLVFAALLGLASLHSRATPFPPTTPEFIRIDENNLWPGNPPALDAGTLSPSQAAAFVAAVKQERIEGRYVVGSCEDRAHFVALLARKTGLTVNKIWAIAPARYTLLSRELIALKDPVGVVDAITWGHHVAVVARVAREDGTVHTMVLDHTFAVDRLLPLADWTQRLGPQTKFFFTGPTGYLFNSLNSFIVSNNDPEKPERVTLPAWMPNILTGDFMTYSSSHHDKHIEAGMAQDELAMHIFDRIAEHPAAEAKYLRQAIKTENSLKKIVGSDPVPELAVETRNKLKQYYSARLQHWRRRLADLQ